MKKRDEQITVIYLKNFLSKSLKELTDEWEYFKYFKNNFPNSIENEDEGGDKGEFLVNALTNLSKLELELQNLPESANDYKVFGDIGQCSNDGSFFSSIRFISHREKAIYLDFN